MAINTNFTTDTEFQYQYNLLNEKNWTTPIYLLSGMLL